MSTMRTIGYRIFSLAKDQNKEEILMKKLNFSPVDMQKLYDGRLVFSDEEMEIIANELNTTADAILDYEETNAYPDMVHCMSGFSNQENCDKILDIIDSYIYIKEAVLNS